MKRAQKWKISAIIVGTVIAFVLVGAAVLSRVTTNCGGNSQALANCGTIPKIFFFVSAEHDNQPVSIGDMSASERQDFAGLALPNEWDARLLVTSRKVSAMKPSPTAIVAICDRPFNNVPWQMIGRAPLKHAVAYETGGTGLLSVEEFRRLDLAGFVDVSTIPDAKVEQASVDQPATRSELKTQ